MESLEVSGRTGKAVPAAAWGYLKLFFSFEDWRAGNDSGRGVPWGRSEPAGGLARLALAYSDWKIVIETSFPTVMK